MAQRDLEHFPRDRHFQIERQADLFAEPFDVVIRDMPTVFTQVSRYPIRTRLRRELGGT